MIKDLAFLLATDSVTYARYAQSLEVMKAEAEAIKAQIQWTTWIYQRRLEQARKDSGKAFG